MSKPTIRNANTGPAGDSNKEANIIGRDTDSYDWPELMQQLNALLRLRTTPIGMKMFATAAELDTIPKLRRPSSVHTTDQIVGQASRNGWTVGITAEDLVGAQCATVIGLHPRNEKWLSGEHMAGVWFENAAEASVHQAAMDVVPHGKYEAMAVSPLTSGRLTPPDICLIYATPAQMIILINGLQWTGYKKFDWSCVGESSCADSWGRALATGEPSLSIPCFAERRYGGVMEDELLMAMPPAYLPKTIAGMQALSRNGLRYPIAPYGVTNDARAGMGVSYADK